MERYGKSWTCHDLQCLTSKRNGNSKLSALCKVQIVLPQSVPVILSHYISWQIYKDGVVFDFFDLRVSADQDWRAVRYSQKDGSTYYLHTYYMIYMCIYKYILFDSSICLFYLSLCPRIIVLGISLWHMDAYGILNVVIVDGCGWHVFDPQGSLDPKAFGLA